MLLPAADRQTAGHPLTAVSYLVKTARRRREERREERRRQEGDAAEDR